MKKSILKVNTKDNKKLYVACSPDRSFFRMVQLSSWYGCYFELTNYNKNDFPEGTVLTLGKLEKFLEENHLSA